MKSSSPQRRTILIVDDDPSVLGMMDETLSDNGYSVLLAQSGTSALEVVARTVPDLILVDALMPGMTGWEVCETLHQDYHLSSIPLIFMTGLTETEHVLRAFEAGAVDYVTKPLRLEETLARISVHIEAAARIRTAQTALDSAGRFLFAATSAGALLWRTPQAADLLDKDELDLPTILRRFSTLPPPGQVIDQKQVGENEVLITFVGVSSTDELLFRISSHALLPEKTLQEALNISAREAEVLLWISRGKTSRDIADILLVSPRTIDKHIEQIYNKTGLSTRSAAAATASRILQQQ